MLEKIHSFCWVAEVLRVLYVDQSLTYPLTYPTTLYHSSPLCRDCANWSGLPFRARPGTHRQGVRERRGEAEEERYSKARWKSNPRWGDNERKRNYIIVGIRHVNQSPIYTPLHTQAHPNITRLARIWWSASGVPDKRINTMQIDMHKWSNWRISNQQMCDLLSKLSACITSLFSSSIFIMFAAFVLTVRCHWLYLLCWIQHRI